VYDAVRPLAVQWILWEKLDSIPPKIRTNYVADPKKGSIHNYGCAVDLTIIDTERLQPLDMGTKFDFFGYLAYPRKEAEMLEKGLLTKEQVANRQLLRDVMQEAGYEGITSEWWHFNFYPRKTAEKKYKIVE
jgi:D-alanyl-D-alanine dipeptidase